MKVLQFWLPVACLAILAGCSTLGAGGKPIDYGSAATQAKSLEIPPDLTTPSVDEHYKMPASDTSQVATYSAYSKSTTAPTQPAETVLPDIPNVLLERNDSERWLVISDKPEAVWEMVKSFWQENGLSIKSADPAAGLMETDWAENRAKIPQDGYKNEDDLPFGSKLYSTGERDQYTTRLERSKDGKSTEVHITQRGMEEVFSPDKKTSTWQSSGRSPEREAIMLQRLMVYFGSSQARAEEAVKSSAASDVAPAPQAAVAPVPTTEPPGTSSLREISDGLVVIAMNDTFDKAWRKIGLAIESSGLALEDKDRSLGTYFLSPLKPETGWLDFLKFWKSRKPVSYRVIVKDGGDTCQVSVTDESGAKSKATRQLTELIFRNIGKQ